MVTSVQKKKLTWTVCLKKLCGRLWLSRLYTWLLYGINFPKKSPYILTWKANRTGLATKSELITTVAIIAGMNILVYFILTNIWRIDPKNMRQKKRPVDQPLLSPLLYCSQPFYAWSFTVLRTLENIRFSTNLIFAATGLFFALVVLPILKANYFAGLRRPGRWRIQDNWRKPTCLRGNYFLPEAFPRYMSVSSTGSGHHCIFIIMAAIVIIPAFILTVFTGEKKKAPVMPDWKNICGVCNFNYWITSHAYLRLVIGILAATWSVTL